MTRNFILVLSVAVVLSFSSSCWSAPILEVTDCIKCHETQPREIEEAGGAHKTEINCLECHVGHRPVSPNNIPACGECHEGTEHYKLAECMGCHNPHQPKNVVLKGELKLECASCHPDENNQIDANPSKHTQLACNFCHADKHKVIQPCLDCHESHSAEMTQQDCAVCHMAHAPTLLEYPDTTPNQLCAACHDTAFDQLSASTTKHHDVSCVECHAGKHKVVQQCSDCHGTPHSAGLHAKFSKCSDCHHTAHDLNNLK